MENGNILQKISSKYIFNNIFEYSYDYSLKYKLIKYSKKVQEKYEITKIEYQKISSIIKYKLISPENILENKKKIIENASKEQKKSLKELMNKLIISSYRKEVKSFCENNENDYFTIKNDKMINLFFENSIFIPRTNLEINLTEELLNNNEFINYINTLLLNTYYQIFLTFFVEDENINSWINKFNDIKISNSLRIGLNFPYYKNICPNNILEFCYDGDISSDNFKIINSFQNLTYLKLLNNTEKIEALINFKKLIFLSVQNYSDAEIIIESEEIAKNLNYFEFDDGEIIKFKFNSEPTKNKVNFENLEYLYFQYDIIDFNKSTKIKKLKDNKIELINQKMEFFLNLLLNCRKIDEIDLDVYQINKINQDRLKLFFQVLKSLSLKSLIISSSFEKDTIFDIVRSENISKSCKQLKLSITDLDMLDYIIQNYTNLEILEINIESKIAKFRINTPNKDNIKLLNENLYKKYQNFKSNNNWLNIKENQKGKIKKLIINNSNFLIIQQNINCYSFAMLIELRLKNIPIRVNTLPLFNLNINIYFSSLKVLIIKIMNYVDSFYQLEFKRKTLINNLGGLDNPYDINMNLIDIEAIENFSKNINRIPNIRQLALNFMLPGIKKDILKDLLDKILDLKFLNILEFCISPTSEQKILKNNQLIKLFPKLKKNKILLPYKLNISVDI